MHLSIGEISVSFPNFYDILNRNCYEKMIILTPYKLLYDFRAPKLRDFEEWSRLPYPSRQINISFTIHQLSTHKHQNTHQYRFKRRYKKSKKKMFSPHRKTHYHDLEKQNSHHFQLHLLTIKTRVNNKSTYQQWNHTAT